MSGGGGWWRGLGKSKMCFESGIIVKRDSEKVLKRTLDEGQAIKNINRYYLKREIFFKKKHSQILAHSERLKVICSAFLTNHLSY